MVFACVSNTESDNCFVSYHYKSKRNWGTHGERRHEYSTIVTPSVTASVSAHDPIMMLPIQYNQTHRHNVMHAYIDDVSSFNIPSNAI